MKQLLPIALALLLTLAGRAADGAVTVTSTPPFRIGFTTTMFTEVNIDDARAAMKVWIRTVGQERGIPIEPEPEIYDGLDRAREDLKRGHIAGIALTANLYHELRKDVEFDQLAAASNDGSVLERYTLLVQEGRATNGLAGLRGGRVVFQHTPRCCLMKQWVTGELRQAGLPACDAFFASSEDQSKASQALLAVFFGRVDAVVVTTRAYDLACELNPQLRTRLRAIATSPDLLPSLFAFRKGSSVDYRERMFDAIRNLHETPAGRQILLLAQSQRVEPQPVKALDPTMALIDTWQGGPTNAAVPAKGGAP